MNEKKENRKVLLIVVMLTMIVAIIVCLGVWEYRKVYRECYVEAGVVVHAQDFLKNVDERGYFTSDSEIIDKSVPGEYRLKLRTGWFVHNCKLVITDTIPPTAKPQTVSMEVGQRCGAEKFVSEIVDATDVKTCFLEEPDFSKGGKQEVKVRLIDAGGNTADINSELFLSQVVKELDVEVGSNPPTLKDFVIDGERAEFISKITSDECKKIGDKTVTLKVDGIVYQSKVHVVDTVPPQVSVHDIDGYTLIPRKPEDFVTYVEDMTEVDISFIEKPDFTNVGTQDIEISFTDEGGNKIVKKVKLSLKEDTEPPVITGATDLSVIEGQAVSYKKNVVVTDNCPEGLQFTVDNSVVKLNQVGVYPVVYRAVDYAGNATSTTVSLTVRPRVYDANEVNAIADKVLARILSEGMTPMEKVRAIYNYVKAHISYISHSEKGNQVRAAYEGLVDGKGDCYVYACTAKVLLTRAGIENMDIVKIPAKTNHYWNLVNLGDGWYHFDTTPRKDHPTIFMWTEAQMMDYSARHKGSHNYDHSLYPLVN